jgi:ABC-type multidrug transport system ATPase subunit/ABC-type multidrug transport system permease subunit
VLLADLTCQETFEFAHENSTSINTVLTHDEIENHAFKLLQGEMKEQGDTTTDKGHLTDDQKQRLKELEEIVKENHDTLNNTTIDMLLKVLEIPHVAHTIVGNAIKKGISGGQKRRVSIGEALMKKAPILLGDEVTNGLDAVTAFRVVQSIRKMCKFLHYTSIMSVLQPSPDTYSLFDYIIMLTEEGNVAYAGPRLNEHGEDASLEYFQSIGLQKPPDAVMPQPDFLDIVCQGPESTEQFAAQYDNDLKLFMDGNLKEDNTGNQPFLCKSMKQRKKKYPSYPSNNGTGSIEDGTKHRPDNVADFKACWTGSAHFKQTEKEADDQLARWEDSSNENEKAKPFNPMYKERFGTTFMENLKSLTARQWLLQKKDEDTWKGTIAQAILVGNMCGTMFWQLGDSGVDGQSKAGLFIFIVANLVFSTFEILPSMFAQRPTLYNQLKQGYVRVPAYVICQILTAFPLDLFRAVVFGSIVYWQAGLSSDFGKFLYYILVCLLLCLMSNQVTRVFCACSPQVGLAQSLAPLFGMVIGIGFSGYVLPRDEMPKYMVWIYYCSPFQYLYQGLMINEQAGQDMSRPYFQRAITSGDLQLKSFNYSTDEYMKWVNFVIGFLFWIAFIILNMMAYKFLRFDEHAKAGETQAEKAEEKATVRETSPWFRGEPTKVSKARPKVLNDPKCDVPTIGKKVCMSFKDLSWEIDIPSKSGNGTQKLRILTNTFGFFRPGSATALMGSSGAGKSTLMDVLLGMKTTGRITGEIYVNKQPFERKYKGKKITGDLEEDKLKDAIVQFPTELRRYIGYVEQFNIHYDTQTVEEAFYFSCKTRLNPIGADGKTPVQDEDRHEMVQYALEVLKLTHCKDLPISDLNSQEAKRTTMGVELVADPSILMLDEPTSGLDSVGALTVMRSIGEIKKTGVTVVVVIHQPSENLFDYFDSLLLLKRGGRVVYFGACPKREKPATPTTPATEAKHIQAFQFFRDMRGAPVWRNENPADYILKFCDGNFDIIFASGELCTRMKEYVAEHKYLEGTGIEISAHDDMPVLPEYPRMYALSDWDQVKTIYWRARSDYWRNPGYNFIRMVVALFSALFLGLMYLQLGDDQQQCGFRLTLPFMMIVFQIPYTLMAMTPVFNTRAVHFRERQSLCYRERSYFTITGFVEAPYIFASINIFMWPVFLLSDLNQGGDRVFFYWIFLCSFQFFNVFYGQMVATLAPNGDVAQKIAPATLALYILSCGFMLQPDNIPNYWKWLYWFSPYHYALEALGANELYGRDCGFADGAGSRDILKAYDLDFDHRYRNLLIILLYALVCRIGSLLALKYVNWVER